jgi:hypothetical protein
MDDRDCQRFFLQPNNPCQRRYEALRAVLVDKQNVAAVAQRLGFAYGSLRNLVSGFRAQIERGQTPPFSDLFRSSSIPTANPPRPFPTSLWSPIAEASCLAPLASCALAPRGCSCFSLCSLNSTSSDSSNKPAIPARK